MKLYFFPIAPNPTRVRIYLAEKGIEIEQVKVDLVRGEQKLPAHLERNPFGNLPVLELDEGRYLTESAAIVELFEELYPEPPMIGRDPLERARVRSLDRIADLGVLLRVGRIVHATCSPLGWPPNPEVAKNEWRFLPKALEVLDQRIADRAFVAGDQASIVDCTLYAALAFARFGQVEIDPGYRNLLRWQHDFSKRPSANL